MSVAGVVVSSVLVVAVSLAVFSVLSLVGSAVLMLAIVCGVRIGGAARPSFRDCAVAEVLAGEMRHRCQITEADHSERLNQARAAEPTHGMQPR